MNVLRTAHIQATVPLVALFLCTGTSSAQTSAPGLIGVWRMVVPPSLESGPCHDASVEFKTDGTLLTRSGALVLTADYSATPKGDGFLVVERSLRSNGQPNCQGVPAGYFVDHFVHRAYFESRGDTLHKYADESRARELLIMIRMGHLSSSPRDSTPD